MAGRWESLLWGVAVSSGKRLDGRAEGRCTGVGWVLELPGAGLALCFVSSWII